MSIEPKILTDCSKCRHDVINNCRKANPVYYADLDGYKCGNFDPSYSKEKFLADIKMAVDEVLNGDEIINVRGFGIHVIVKKDGV